MDRAYGTHLPVLTGLEQHFDYQVVLENGVGLWSTPHFLKNCSRVISTEFDRRWAGRYDTGHPRHTLIIPDYGFVLPHAGVQWFHCNPVQQQAMVDWFQRFRSEIETLDLLFVDGSPCERMAALKALVGHPTAIVLHDTNLDYYYPDLTFLDLEYDWTECNVIMPWTRLYVKKSADFDIGAVASTIRQDVAVWMAEGR